VSAMITSQFETVGAFLLDLGQISSFGSCFDNSLLKELVGEVALAATGVGTLAAVERVVILSVII